MIYGSESILSFHIVCVVYGKITICTLLFDLVLRFDIFSVELPSCQYWANVCGLSTFNKPTKLYCELFCPDL